MAPTIQLQYSVIDGYVRHPMFPELLRKKNETGLYLEINGNLRYIGRRIFTLYGRIVNEFVVRIPNVDISSKYSNAMWEYSANDPAPPPPTCEQINAEFRCSHMDD